MIPRLSDKNVVHFQGEDEIKNRSLGIETISHKNYVEVAIRLCQNRKKASRSVDLTILFCLPILSSDFFYTQWKRFTGRRMDKRGYKDLMIVFGPPILVLALQAVGTMKFL